MEHFLEVVKQTVNPSTQPVGVNLVADTADVEGKKIRLHGKRIAVCPQIAYRRYYGWSTWMTADTSHCVLGASCTGLVEAPKRVLDGSVNTGVYQRDQAAAEAMQQAMPRVPVGTGGVLTYPLSRPVEGFFPQAVVVYANTAQAMRFVQAFLYHRGGEFTARSSGDAGVCSRGVAQVILSGEPSLEVPCLGDRRFAMAQDHEMIIGIPGERLAEVAEGLEATHKAGIRYPVPFQLPDACDLPPAFVTDREDT